MVCKIQSINGFSIFPSSLFKTKVLFVLFSFLCSFNMTRYKMIMKLLRKRAILAFLFVIISLCVGEDREIYLVMMEDEPVAFHGGSVPFEEGKRVDPKSEVSIGHGKKLVESHEKLLMSNLEKGSYKKLYSFKHIVNGFALHTTPSQVKKIKQAKGVKLVEKDRGAKMMTTYTPQFLGLNTLPRVQTGGERDSGAGIVIGIVDTGINPFHPSFAFDPLTINNNFSNTNLSNYENNNNKELSHFNGECEVGPRFPSLACNGKIVSARYFSAGAQSAATLDPTFDFLSPFDAVGHGSHVASTAAGNYGVPVVVNSFCYGQASGMAPRARIAVYKAIYPTVGTLTDVLAAIDQATLDGVDVLTLSIGPDEPPEDTLTILNMFDLFMLSARRAGVFVVQAGGNHGPGPNSVLSYSPWAVGVGSCSTDRNYNASLFLGNGHQISGVGLSGPSFGSENLKYRLVLAKDAVKADMKLPKTPQDTEECQNSEALDPAKVEGSLVICTFSSGFYNGTSSVTAILDTAKALGFMGFVFVANPSFGDFVAEPIPFDVAGIMIPRTSDVKIISDYYEENTQRDEKGKVVNYNARAGIGEGRVATYIGRAPVVSRFSSRGPDIINSKGDPSIDVLKPDILAPGHQIWAAWSPMSVSEPVLVGNNFALLSGTSMATPHIAGIAALIKQHNPLWTPSMIASAMATTATKYDNQGDPLFAEGFNLYTLNPSTPFDLGAGVVNPRHALHPGLVFESEYDDYINFMCTLPNTDPSEIKTATGGSCTHSLYAPSDLNIPSITISALSGPRSVRRTVTNVEREIETYVSAVISPKGVTVAVNPTYFTIAPNGNQELDIMFNVTQTLEGFSFGEVVLTGSLNHIVRIPLSILPVSVS